MFCLKKKVFSIDDIIHQMISENQSWSFVLLCHAFCKKRIVLLTKSTMQERYGRFSQSIVFLFYVDQIAVYKSLLNFSKWADHLPDFYTLTMSITSFKWKGRSFGLVHKLSTKILGRCQFWTHKNARANKRLIKGAIINIWKVI